MTPPRAPEDLPRDAHLHAALRHAPDVDRHPPPHLRAQIIAAAHRTLAEQPARSQRPRRAWAPGPLGASGALASLLLAGVIGLIWREAPPDPAADGPAASSPALSVPEPARPAPTIQPAQPIQPIQPTQPALRTPDAKAMASPAPAPRVAAAAPPSAKTAPRPGGVAAEGAAEAEAAAEAMPGARTGVESAPVPTQAPVPATSSEQPVAAAPPAVANPAPGADAAATPSAGLRSPLQAEATEPQRARSVPASPTAAAAAAPQSLLRWRIDGIEHGAVPPAWAEAVRARAWDRPQGEPSAPSPLPGARRIDLIGPAGAVANVWLSQARLLWCPADGSGCRLSTLEPEDAAALARALPPAAPTDQPPKRDSR